MNLFTLYCSAKKHWKRNPSPYVLINHFEVWMSLKKCYSDNLKLRQFPYFHSGGGGFEKDDLIKIWGRKNNEEAKSISLQADGI